MKSESDKWIDSVKQAAKMDASDSMQGRKEDASGFLQQVIILGPSSKLFIYTGFWFHGFLSQLCWAFGVTDIDLNMSIILISKCASNSTQKSTKRKVVIHEMMYKN
jgi:hypothetical protein